MVVDDAEDEQPEYKVETQSYSQHHVQKITHFTEKFLHKDAELPESTQVHLPLCGLAPIC